MRIRKVDDGKQKGFKGGRWWMKEKEEGGKVCGVEQLLVSS